MSHTHKSEVPGNLGILSYKLFGWAVSMAGCIALIALLINQLEIDENELSAAEKKVMIISLVLGFVTFGLACFAGIRFGNLVTKSRSVMSPEMIVGFGGTLIACWLTYRVISTENPGYMVILAVVGYLFMVFSLLAGR